jgi:hypothetical protein
LLLEENERQIITGSADGSVKVYSYTTGGLYMEFHRSSGEVVGIYPIGDRFYVIVYSNGDIHTLNVNYPISLDKDWLNHKKKAISCAAFHQGSSVLATGNEHDLTTWSTKSQNILYSKFFKEALIRLMFAEGIGLLVTQHNDLSFNFLTDSNLELLLTIKCSVPRYDYGGHTVLAMRYSVENKHLYMGWSQGWVTAVDMEPLVKQYYETNADLYQNIQAKKAPELEAGKLMSFFVTELSGVNSEGNLSEQGTDSLQPLSSEDVIKEWRANVDKIDEHRRNSKMPTEVTQDFSKFPSFVVKNKVKANFLNFDDPGVIHYQWTVDEKSQITSLCFTDNPVCVIVGTDQGLLSCYTLTGESLGHLNRYAHMANDATSWKFEMDNFKVAKSKKQKAEELIDAIENARKIGKKFMPSMRLARQGTLDNLLANSEKASSLAGAIGYVLKGAVESDKVNGSLKKKKNSAMDETVNVMQEMDDIAERVRTSSLDMRDTPEEPVKTQKNKNANKGTVRFAGDSKSNSMLELAISNADEASEEERDPYDSDDSVEETTEEVIERHLAREKIKHEENVAARSERFRRKVSLLSNSPFYTRLKRSQELQRQKQVVSVPRGRDGQVVSFGQLMKNFEVEHINDMRRIQSTGSYAMDDEFGTKATSETEQLLQLVKMNACRPPSPAAQRHIEMERSKRIAAFNSASKRRDSTGTFSASSKFRPPRPESQARERSAAAAERRRSLSSLAPISESLVDNLHRIGGMMESCSDYLESVKHEDYNPSQIERKSLTRAGKGKVKPPVVVESRGIRKWNKALTKGQQEKNVTDAVELPPIPQLTRQEQNRMTGYAEDGDINLDRLNRLGPMVLAFTAQMTDLEREEAQGEEGMGGGGGGGGSSGSGAAAVKAKKAWGRLRTVVVPKSPSMADVAMEVVEKQREVKKATLLERRAQTLHAAALLYGGHLDSANVQEDDDVGHIPRPSSELESYSRAYLRLDAEKRSRVQDEVISPFRQPASPAPPTSSSNNLEMEETMSTSHSPTMGSPILSPSPSLSQSQTLPSLHAEMPRVSFDYIPGANRQRNSPEVSPRRRASMKEQAVKDAETMDADNQGGYSEEENMQKFLQDRRVTAILERDGMPRRGSVSALLALQLFKSAPDSRPGSRQSTTTATKL